MPLFLLLLVTLCQWAVGSAAAGAATGMHLAPVLAQPIARGEVIRGESLVMQEIKRSPAGIDYITDSEALIGMAAKRPLRAGVPLRMTDIAQPKIILKGELVTVAFEAPGLILSVRGKALEDAVQGQTIRVLNTQTSRPLEGAAASAGYVLVSPMASPAPQAAQISRLEAFSTTALPGQ